MEVELTFVEAFVQPSKKERIKEMLPSKKRRRKALGELAHGPQLDPRWLKPITDTAGLERLLRSKGAPETCHAISENPEIDGKNILLSAALQAVVGYGMGSILIRIPSRLAYYEGEGPSDRWLLEK